MRKNLLVIMVGLCLFVATSQAYWTGGGDGASFGDPNNWSETDVPLTSGGATSAVINANAAVTTVNLDAATADTLVDGTSTNFLSTQAQAADRTLDFNADWGNGYTNAGMWVGQSTAGTVNFNSNAGTLTTTSGSYIGRSSLAGGIVNFDVNGGTVGFKQIYIGALSDSLGDLTLNATGGTVYLGQSDSIANGGILGRIQSGAYASGQTTKVAIGGDATVVAYDWRIGSLGGGLGTDMLEITGSNATITFDHNFYTKQNSGWLGQTVIKFVADENGVSAITAYDADATLRIDENAILIVDLTNYQGTDDLVLFDYTRYTGPDDQVIGGYEFGTVEIIGRDAELVYENTVPPYDNTNSGRIYVTNFCSLSANLTNGDCIVNLEDFSILASNWLACNAADCL